MRKYYPIVRAVAAFTALAAGAQALASISISVPPGATDFHFLFKDGNCTGLRLDRLNPEIWPHDATITGFGCKGAEAYFDFTPGESGPYTLTLPRVFAPGDPYLETYEGGKATILRAWWTPDGTTMFENYVLAMPETGTWTMLIAGFGIVGATMRRRRSATA